MKKLLLAICTVAFISSQGAGQFTVQILAWSNMIWTFAQTSSLQTAVIKTFNGKNPCSLCHKIKKAASGQSFTIATTSSEKEILIFPNPERKPGDKPQSFATAYTSALLHPPDLEPRERPPSA